LDTIMNRRQVLVLGGAGVVSACQPTGGGSAVFITTEVVNDVTAAATALKNAEPLLNSIVPPPFPASTMATIDAATTKIVTLGGQVTTSTAAAAGLSVVQQIETVVESLVQVGAEVAPPPYGTALAAAAVLMPLAIAAIQTALGQVQPPAPASSAKMARLRASMSPEQARAALARINATYGR
jgi:hypothetical protein